MSQEFDAIFEGGVFRPLTPLSLPESAKVTIVLQNSNSPTIPSDDLQRQQQALNAMFAAVDSLPQPVPNDAFDERNEERRVIQEGINAWRAGDTQDFDQFDAEFRAKNGIQ